MPRPAEILRFLTLCVVAALASQADAAPPAQAADSPRDAVEQFTDLGREGRWADAARLLQLPEGVPESDAPGLAKRLRFVLDHEVWLDPSQLSDDPEGRLDDGLTPDTEEIGSVTRKEGVAEPVRLVRVQDADGSRWLFSAATVGYVDRWFGGLKDRWILEHLPTPLLAPGPLGLLWWQWLALPIFVLVAWFAGFFLSRLTHSLLARLVTRTKASWDDAVLARVSGPLTLAWLLGVLYVLLPLLGLSAYGESIARGVLTSGVFVGVLWALLRSVDVFIEIVQRSPWTTVHPAASSLLPLGGRVAKILIFVLAVVTALATLGVQIGGLLAGLGIGGLAIALAAQKTVENLVGAFSIGLDQPFKEGDFVKLGEHSGHVEQIGLRSTRVRTLDRTIVTIPNAQVAEQRVETFTPRDRIRLALTVGIEYGATREQILQIVSGFERVLRGHPRIWPDTVVVRFTDLGKSSLDIEVLCWCNSADINEYRDFRQEVLLGFMDVVEKAGSGFAFPTQTVHQFEHRVEESRKAGK